MKISNRAAEVLIGALVLIVVINFSINLYETKKLAFNSSKEYRLHASFDRIDGVGVGTTVTISGIKVGQVIDQQLDKQNYNAILTMTIDKEISLPVDTLAEIVSSSLLGDKYVSLVPGADSELLKDDGKIEFTQSSISFESLISKMLFGIESGKNKDQNSRNEVGVDGEEVEDEHREHKSEGNDKEASIFSNSNVG